MFPRCVKRSLPVSLPHCVGTCGGVVPLKQSISAETMKSLVALIVFTVSHRGRGGRTFSKSEKTQIGFGQTHKEISTILGRGGGGCQKMINASNRGKPICQMRGGLAVLWSMTSSCHAIILPSSTVESAKTSCGPWILWSHAKRSRGPLKLT